MWRRKYFLNYLNCSPLIAMRAKDNSWFRGWGSALRTGPVGVWPAEICLLLNDFAIETYQDWGNPLRDQVFRVGRCATASLPLEFVEGHTELSTSVFLSVLREWMMNFDALSSCEIIDPQESIRRLPLYYPFQVCWNARHQQGFPAGRGNNYWLVTSCVWCWVYHTQFNENEQLHTGTAFL